jgi:TPR repeat protein
MRWFAVPVVLVALVLPSLAKGEYFEGLYAIADGKYEKGLGIWRDDAAHGDVGIQIILGLYLVGDGNLPARYRNFDEGIKWLERAAARDVQAQGALGTVYAEGRPGHPPDFAKAVRWLTTPAGQGDLDAQYVLGQIYATGDRTVPQDLAVGIKWIRAAAEHGSDDAQFDLAQRFDSGRGVAADLKQAVGWYQRAADQGHAQALLTLGRLYRDGRGLPQSNAEAYFWLSLAAMRQPLGDARKPVAAERDAVAARLSPSELSESEQRVRKWQPTLEATNGQ